MSAQGFDAWWHNEGSGMPPLPGEDAETHVHRVCQIAWRKGVQTACPECGGTGGIDSGGVTPWESAIMLPCPICKSCNHPLDDESIEAGEHSLCNDPEAKL